MNEKEIVKTACNAIELSVKTIVKTIKVIKEAKKLNDEQNNR